MKRLIALAEKIKDKKLRERTIKLLEEPEISNSEIIYPKSELKEIPAWIGAHHNYKGGQLEHTINVTEISLSIAEQFEKMYDAKINKDHLIAGALLHDIMKVFILKKSGKNWELTGALLDHADFSACELYARGFPEEVVHIVASHGGETGAANPRTLEALIVYHADVVDSAGESMIRGVPPLQFMIMGGEDEGS